MDHQSCIPVSCFHSWPRITQCQWQLTDQLTSHREEATTKSRIHVYSIFLVCRDIWCWRFRGARSKFLFPDDVTGDPAIAFGQDQLFRAETKWNVNHHYPHIPDHIVNNFFPPLRPLCFGSINCNSYVFLALIFTLDFILIVFVFSPKSNSTDWSKGFWLW